MTMVLFRLTMRELMGQRRSVLMALLALLPILLALLALMLGPDEGESRQQFVSEPLLSVLVVGMLLPLVALIFGTAALGSEIEDGTAVYILAKPVARWKVIFAKVAAAWVATTAIVLTSAVISGLMVLGGQEQQGIIPAFSLGIIVGGLAYVTVFVLLSAMTGRALIIGLGYVLIWEGVFTVFAPGAQLLSIREYALGIADWLSSTSKADFDAELAATQSVLLSGFVIIAGFALAVRRLRSFEAGEQV
jgi:ABC-2 type transport system permease protein